MKEILKKLNVMSLKSKQSDIFLLLVLFLLIFLSTNIYFSQTLSPIYFGLVNNNRKDVVEFLQKIRALPQFAKQINYFENSIGPSLKNDVFSVERAREVKIKELEQILTKNPQSRDVLYSLYLLYKEKNDNLTAAKYLRLAKAVDPLVK